MKEENCQYKLLVHCTINQIREGFKTNLETIDANISTSYVDLAKEGILSKLKFVPDLIVVLFNEGDSDFLLPLKIKLFASSVPLLVISPSVPDRYLNFLKTIGTDKILILPADRDKICSTILAML